MNIDVKFPINKKVYYNDLDSKPHEIVCGLCEGSGFLFIKSREDAENFKKIECPECKGKGILSNNGSIFHVTKESFINGIKISIDESKIEVYYNLDGKDQRYYKEYELFEKLEEAEKIIPKNYYMGYTS